MTFPALAGFNLFAAGLTLGIGLFCAAEERWWLAALNLGWAVVNLVCAFLLAQ